MTYSEFKDKVKSYGRSVKPGTEIRIHADSGDYGVSSLEFDKSAGVLKVCTTDEAKTGTFKVSYVITKDHRTVYFGTVRETAASEDDIIFNFDEFREKYLANYGISGEKSEKTGSTVMEETTPIPVIDGSGKIVRYEMSEKHEHFYNCEILEVMKELDADNDIYIRVWKNGSMA